MSQHPASDAKRETGQITDVEPIEDGAEATGAAGSGDGTAETADKLPRLPPRPADGELLEPVPLRLPTGPRGLDRYTDVKPYIRAGAIAAALLFGGFLLWSVAVPLARGTVAPGILNVESSRKTIQHLEGGIIRAIHVKDGDRVKLGQVLMELESSRATANLGIAGSRLAAAQALIARLVAQRDGLDQVVFPDELLALAATDPEIANILAVQEQTFAAERETLANRRQILDEQIEQLTQQITGTEAQITSYRTQQRLIAEEIQDVTYLYDKGLVERPRLRALQRTEAGLVGDIDEAQARIAQLQQRIAEIRLQRIDLDNAQRQQVSDGLRDAQAQAADYLDEATTARDVVERLDVRAPQDGQIVGLVFHTIGGVVRPGERIAELVPTADELIVSAQVSPLAIDSVHPGLQAEVILSALNQNQVPRLPGTVTKVSADRLVDERSGMPYYSATIRIDGAELAKLPDITLYPGMPADVVIVTGSRSAFDYFWNPLTSTARKAFIAE